MAGIKQTVPNYIFGASNQPDQLKIPGFVNEALNIYPDVTEGCVKRPGTTHINKIETTGIGDNNEIKWFAIDHGGDDRFIGYVEKGGTVRVFECDTGEEWPVHMNYAAPDWADTEPIDYLTHLENKHIQVLNLNDSTILLNRIITPAVDYSGATTSPPQGYKAFVSLSAIAYGKQYALDITDIGAGLHDQPNIFDNPVTTTRATKLSIRWEPGGDRRNDDDNDSGHNVDSEESCRYNTREIRTINVSGNRSGADYDAIGGIRYTGGTATALQDARYSTGDLIGLPGRNLRFEVSMIGTPYVAGYHGSRDGEPYYWALYDINIDLLHGGEGWRVGDQFYIYIGEDGSATKHMVKIEEVEEIESPATWVVRPEPTTHVGSQVLSADKILENLKDEILEADPNNHPSGAFDASRVNVEKIGSGLYIEHPATLKDKFEVTTTEGNLMSIINDTVSSAADLPSECKHGYVVKVSNSTLDEDDYYLKFNGELGISGKGTWVETVAPESFNHINPKTMPHKLVMHKDMGVPYFSLEPLEWADRLAGDDVTNPRPTFLKSFHDLSSDSRDTGSPISSLLFWRNRLVILSKNNICLTQPLTTEAVQEKRGTVYDVWGKSALALSPGDAIDITATSNQVTNLKHGIEVNAGLMLFSEYEQFLLTTDSDVVTPETVKVKRVSSWSYSEKCAPISLGNSIAFCDNAGRHTRLFEMSNITRETEPLVTELSKPITRDIPANVRSIAESRENGLVVLSHDRPIPVLPNPGDSVIGDSPHCNNPTDYVYVYKYFTSGNKRIQSAWFKWKFPGLVLWHTIIRDTYYLLVDNESNTDVRLLAMDLVRNEDYLDSPLRTPTFAQVDPNTCNLNRIHLDEMAQLGNSASSDGRYTRYTIPNSYYTGTDGTDIIPGQLWLVYNEDFPGVRVKAYQSGGEVYTAGPIGGGDPIMGIGYDMKLKLPQIYPTKKAGDAYIADTTSTLTIHRCKFSMGTSGDFSVNVNLKGGESYSIDFESNTNHTFYTNVDNIIPSQTVDVPVYQPNTDFRLEFKSSNPAPCTLNSMTWEGDYNTLYRSA